MTDVSKLDRRVQRTRQLLKDSLIELLSEKKYDDITVQNILDKANLGRATFYLHFQGKEDLLFNSVEEVVHSLVWHIEIPDNEITKNQGKRVILNTQPLFFHALKQSDLHKTLLMERGMDMTLKMIRDHLCLHIQDKLENIRNCELLPNVPISLISNFLASSLLTLLLWWFESKMAYSPETMDEMYQQLTMPGVMLALNMPTD